MSREEIACWVGLAAAIAGFVLWMMRNTPSAHMRAAIREQAFWDSLRPPPPPPRPKQVHVPPFKIPVEEVHSWSRMPGQEIADQVWTRILASKPESYTLNRDKSVAVATDFYTNEDMS